MSKTIVLVGHCGPDSSYLRMAVMSAAKGASVVAADSDEELREALGHGPSLLLLNRLLDYGFAERDGVSLIRRLRKECPQVPLMLVSNFEDAQAAALAAGALPGFGKREIGTRRVTELLRSALQSQP